MNNIGPTIPQIEWLWRGTVYPTLRRPRQPRTSHTECRHVNALGPYHRTGGPRTLRSPRRCDRRGPPIPRAALSRCNALVAAGNRRDRVHVLTICGRGGGRRRLMTVPFKSAWSFGRPRPQPAEPALLTNPADDGAFREEALAALHLHITPAGLEAALRRRYPRIAVHVRELVHEPFVVWYVYREGRWLGPEERGASTDDGSGPRRGGSEGDL